MSKYLVGYISKTGTAKEIAERIASKFRANKIETDIVPLENIKSLDQYSGIILGSPINGMKLLPEFKAFIEANQSKLNNVIGFFVVSYMFAHARNFWKRAIQKDIDRVNLLFKPQSVTVFGGRINRRMPGFANLIFGLSKDMPLDVRNWDKIEEWTDELIGKIRN